MLKINHINAVLNKKTTKIFNLKWQPEEACWIPPLVMKRQSSATSRCPHLFKFFSIRKILMLMLNVKDKYQPPQDVHTCSIFSLKYIGQMLMLTLNVNDKVQPYQYPYKSVPVSVSPSINTLTNQYQLVSISSLILLQISANINTLTNQYLSTCTLV